MALSSRRAITRLFAWTSKPHSRVRGTETCRRTSTLFRMAFEYGQTRCVVETDRIADRGLSQGEKVLELAPALERSRRMGFMTVSNGGTGLVVADANDQPAGP